MYPVETVTDFNDLTSLIVMGAVAGAILILTVFLISWAFGMLVKFFKELAR